MQERARQNPKISWALDRIPLRVVTKEDKVSGLKIRNNATGDEEVIEADGIFIAIGHLPNSGFLNGQIETDAVGYIQVKPGTTETSIPGVMACGDVQDSKYRQAVTAAGTGCMAALDTERFLEGQEVVDWSQSLP